MPKCTGKTKTRIRRSDWVKLKTSELEAPEVQEVLEVQGQGADPGQPVVEQPV